MAIKTIGQIVNVMTNPTTSDLIPIWNDAQQRTDVISRASLVGAIITGLGNIATGGYTLTIGADSAINGQLTGGGIVATAGYNLTLAGHSAINGTITGAGTIGTAGYNLVLGGHVTINGGGFTLTVPATGTAALRGTFNIFTVGQEITPATDAREGLRINMPAGATYGALRLDYNGAQLQQAYVASDTNRYFLVHFDNGVGAGPYLWLGRNNNGSTPSAGFIQFTDRGGAYYYVHADDSGIMRVHTAAPVHGADTTGTVIGTQTSMAAAKHISDGLSAMDEVQARIRRGAKSVQRFTYRSGAFGGQTFEGVVIDDAPDYGMDRDTEHPAGKALNEIGITGDLLRFADWAMARIEALESKLL